MAAQAELDAKTRTPVAALAQLAKSLIDALMLARIFHEVAPVCARFIPLKWRRQRSNVQSSLHCRGYVGWRGACGRGLALNSSQRPAGLCCGRLAQSASRLHPRQSRVPRETSGLGVQRTAELNLAAPRRLLARSGSPWSGGPAIDNWRFSWRAFEIVSNTADDVLRLCDAHSRSSIDELWNAIEARQEALRLDTTCARELRTAFDGMRAASGAYFEAATNTHRRLLAIAEGGKP